MALPYALVVEDDPLVAELFRRALQDAGYQADVLENGHRAQAQLAFTTPDLIVIDLLMPTMSGGVLLRQIRGQQRLWHTRVIVATGDGDAAEPLRPVADEVLIKPIGYEQLRSVAAQYLPAI